MHVAVCVLVAFVSQYDNGCGRDNGGAARSAGTDAAATLLRHAVAPVANGGLTGACAATALGLARSLALTGGVNGHSHRIRHR